MAVHLISIPVVDLSTALHSMFAGTRPTHPWVESGVLVVRAVETLLVDHRANSLIKPAVLIVIRPTQVRDVQHRGMERGPFSCLSELRACVRCCVDMLF